MTYDPTTIFTNVQTFVTGSLLPAVAGFVVLGISIRLALGAVRKYSKGLK